MVRLLCPIAQMIREETEEEEEGKKEEKETGDFLFLSRGFIFCILSTTHPSVNQ